jgi:uncharacterized protein
MLNSACNLRCKYCYEAKYGFKNTHMNERIIDQSMEFIRKQCAEGSEVSIYGGEPFLDFDLVKYLFDKYPIYNYSLFTNTLLMTQEIIDFLSERQDFLIMDISLDGAEESQVKNRGAMYDKDIVRQIFRKFRHTGVRMIVVDPEKCYENCEALRVLGAKRIDLNYPSFTDFPSKEYMDTLGEQVNLIKSDPKFNDVSINNPYYCVSGKDDLCKIGSERIAISPEGDIYPCDVFYFVDSHKMGNVFDGIDVKLQKEFLEDLDKLSNVDRPCPAHVYCRKREGLVV